MTQVQEFQKAEQEKSPVKLAPWVEFPYQLVSWWEMAQFKCEELHAVIRILDAISEEMARYGSTGDAAFNIGSPIQLPPSMREKQEEALRVVERTMNSIGLKTSGRAVFEYRNFLINWKIQGYGRITSAEAATRIKTIQETIRYEMSTHVFLYVPANRSNYYESYEDTLTHSDDIDEIRFGKEVETNFPQAIEESRPRRGNRLRFSSDARCRARIASARGGAQRSKS